MPVEIYERVNPTTSEDQSGASIRREYFLRGSIDEIEVHEAFVDYLPVTYANLWLVRASVEPQGGPIWHGSAEYGIPQTPPDATLGDPTDVNPGTGLPNNSPTTPGDNELLGPEYSFSTTGGTEKKIWTPDTKLTKFADGYAPMDFQGRIGWKPDGDDEGVEIPSPKMEWATTRYVKVSPAYLNILKDLTGTINDRNWFGWKAGEALFLGAEGQYKDAVKGWSVAFRFAVKRNKVGTGRDPEDRIAGGLFLGTAATTSPPAAAVEQTKRGWDYLWVAYTEAPGGTNAPLVRKPFAFSVVTVFEERDFRKLGLGG